MGIRTNVDGIWQGTRVCVCQLSPNTPISEGGTNSSHTHNLAKSQSYRGLKLLPSDIKLMKMVNPILIYHIFS